MLGVQGPERDDGWVAYPADETVEITAKGLDMLRLPVGTKMEMKRLVTTDELQAVIDVYVSPQAGIFNIKRGFREGGDGFEAVIAELGDDVLMIMPRTEMDTEATGLLKLSLRVKLTAEKEIEKKIQALCKDPRNDSAEIKGIPTKLASGVEVRIVWSGDLGTARVRNGLTRAAAISAELSGKNSEEAKKLRNDLEKQIKANADALLEQDVKLTSYTAHYTMLIDKQAAVVTEMQGKHAEAMTDLHKQMQASEEAHAKMLQDSEQARKDSELSAAYAMDGLRQQIAELQNLQIKAQHNMLAFAARADEMAAALTGHVKRSEGFMEAVRIEMLTQKQEVQMIKNTSGYVEAVTQQHVALTGELALLHTHVTAFAYSVRAGLGSSDEVRTSTSSTHPTDSFDGTSGETKMGGCELAACRAGHIAEGDSSGLGDDCEHAACIVKDGPTGSGGMIGRRGTTGDRVRGEQPVLQKLEGACSAGGERSNTPGLGECASETPRVPDVVEIHGHTAFKGALGGIRLGGILCVESMSLPPAKIRDTSRALELARRDGQRKFGNAADCRPFTRVFHAVILLLALLVPRCDADGSTTRCCTTLDLRYEGTEGIRCYDTAELRCYGTRQGPWFRQVGTRAQLPASCADAGSRFWSCTQELGVRPDPTPAVDVTQRREPDPEPSPRWDQPSQQVPPRAMERSDSGRRWREQRREGGAVYAAVHTSRSQCSTKPRWAVVRHEHGVMADVGSLMRRRLRWYFSRKAWKRRMRALRGNTVEEMFNVALWNAREFHAEACPSREASRAKAVWVLRRLQEEDVDVCFLLEMMGSQEAFTAEIYGLRALAKKIGYAIRWMVGEGGSQREQRQSGESFTNGIAVLVKQATCVIERHARLEERVLGVWIRGRGAKEQLQTRIAAIHGLHHSGISSFEKQLQATYAWAADYSQTVKGCIVVGDFNYVADEAWRSSRTTLSVNDRALRDFIAQPGAEYVLPCPSQPLIVWTRKGGEASETINSDGLGSMLDGAVAIGAECALWRRTVVGWRGKATD